MSVRNSTGHTLLVRRARGPQWYVKLRTPEGRQVKRLLGPAWSKRGRPPEGFFTEALAAARLGEMLEAADRGEYDGRPAHTFGAACREWLRYLEHEEQVAERTLMTDRGAANARLVPFFGEDTPIEDITTRRINEYRSAALLGDERIGRGRPLKKNTVSRDMTNLSAIFKRALEEGWIKTNPYLTAKKVKQKPAKSRDYNALTVPELEVVERAARDEQGEALYRVAALTGLRFGELRALRWRDIEWTAANLHVRKNLPVHATQEKEPKSEEGRSVPMFDQVAREFERLSRRGHLTELDDLVFVSATGGHLDYEHTKDAFYAALEGAGFAHLREKDRKPKPFTFHDLRHTYGTLAVQIYPLSDVQAYMGHADIKTTMIYVHHVPKTDAAAKGSAFVAAAMAGTEIGTELPTSSPTERNSAQLTAA